jgi:hypothetical protein
MFKLLFFFFLEGSLSSLKMKSVGRGALRSLYLLLGSYHDKIFKVLRVHVPGMTHLCLHFK